MECCAFNKITRLSKIQTIWLKTKKTIDRPIGDTWESNLELSRHSKIKNAMPEIKNSINRFC